MSVRPRRRTARILATAATAATVALAFGATGSLADGGTTITLSVSPAPQTALLPLTVTASGEISNDINELFATYKPAGGGCAATPSADTGTVIPEALTGTNPTLPPGTPQPYSVNDNGDGRGNLLTLPAGNWLLCGWVTDGPPGDVLATTQTPFTVQPFAGSLSFSGPPSVVMTRAQLASTLAYSANSPSYLIVDLQHPGMSNPLAPCSAKPGEENSRADEISGPDLVSGFEVGPESNTSFGPTGVWPVNVDQWAFDRFSGALIDGPYLECAWLTSDSAAMNVVAGPVSHAFQVGTPPPIGVISGITQGFIGRVYTVSPEISGGTVTVSFTVAQVVQRHGRRTVIHLATESFPAKVFPHLNQFVLKRVAGHPFARGTYQFTYVTRKGRITEPGGTYVDSTNNLTYRG